MAQIPRPTAHIFSTADALSAGFTRAAIDDNMFLRPFRGVRARRSVTKPRFSTEAMLERMHQFAPIATAGTRFSHTSALVAYGCPIRASETLHVSVPRTRTPPRRPGVRGHHHAPETPHRIHRGLVLAPPAVALVQSAGLISHRELVVAIDHLVCPRGRDASPIISMADLASLLRRSQARGVVLARRALLDGREGAESRMETLLRLALERLGFTDIELQVALADARGFVGRVDMLSRRHRIIFEYDGEQHRTDRRQYVRDVERLDRLRLLGWRVIRVHADDFTDIEGALRGKLALFGVQAHRTAE